MAIDDNTLYGLTGAQVKELPGKIEAVKGLARELTTTDCNWPVANPDGVALWLLEPGMYYTEGVQVYMSGNQIGDITNRGTFIVGDDYGTGNPAKLILYYDQYTPAAYLISTIISSGNRNSKNSLLPPTVVQSTGTSTTSVMSQNATTSMVFADPSAKTKVQIGSAAGARGLYSTAIGSGATTAAGDTGYHCITIGTSSSSKAHNGISIGQQSLVSDNAPYSIALGSFSNATMQGQLDISTLKTPNTFGYNNSQYRLLTGLYDPQNAHDAATKGYVDTAVGAKQDVLTAGDNITIAEESGALVISATGGSSIDTFTTNEWNALWA